MNHTQLDGQPNIYNQFCPSRLILSRVGNKWVVMILAILVKQPMRFGALKMACAGVSQKMLTQELRQLERDGLIVRQVIQKKPLQVSYSITEMGHDLVQVLEPLIDWVHAHFKIIEDRQMHYDQNNDS